MKNIVLTGFMGTGKTAVGRELSNLLGWKFIDIDDEIVKAQNSSISDIFNQHGESAFRDIETEMIRKTAKTNNIIISTGGGAILRQENIDLLRKNGIIICLTARPETILNRTSKSSKRPLLNVDDPLKRIEDLMASRKSFYEKTDFMIDTETRTPLQIAEEIFRMIK